MGSLETKTILKSVLIPAELEQFLNDLIIDSGLEKTEPALKEMMLTDLTDRLNTQLSFTLAQNLNEQELETFEKLAAVDQSQAIAYLTDIKPQMQQIILDALAEFRKTFLEEKNN